MQVHLAVRVDSKLLLGLSGPLPRQRGHVTWQILEDALQANFPL
jgi:hypothetical protein